MKTALICGASGQDGAYLSKLLLDKGYKDGVGDRVKAAAFRFDRIVEWKDFKISILELKVGG